MMRQFITQMKAKGKENIDVQSLVERPNVYILGRCGAFKVEQLAYIKTRKACLQSLSEPLLTSNGAQITDDFFREMAHNKNLKLEHKKVEMLAVYVAVGMLESTRTLPFF